MEQRYFVATHKDKDVLKRSSSGGVFTAITDEWFLRYQGKAVIYGCVLDENLNAKHIRATEPSVRNKMCGSKYIESDVSGAFSRISDDLKNGLYVVFSGTPCQVAGLKSFLSVKGTDSGDRLMTIEVLCHGVGSNRFFDDYIHYLEKKYKGTAVKCSFRAKSRPNKTQDMEVVFSNGKKYNASSTKYDWFYSVYMKNYILRPSCFNCKFAKVERNADVCIFDNWKELYAENGVGSHMSAIIITSKLGYKWFEYSSGSMRYEEKTIDEISQPNLHAPTAKPSDYDKFWQIYNNGGYAEVQRFAGNRTLKGYLRSAVVDLLDFLNLAQTAKLLARFIKKIVGRK